MLQRFLYLNKVAIYLNDVLVWGVGLVFLNGSISQECLWYGQSGITQQKAGVA